MGGEGKVHPHSLEARLPKKAKSRLEVKTEKLEYGARRGDLQLVFRTIYGPHLKYPTEELLHNCLKHRNITEAQALAVVRHDPEACGRPNHVGQYPLHLVAMYTARPTATMIRAIGAAHAHAAATRDLAGWLPLHYLCKNAVARGDTEPRATAELVLALRALHPDAAMASLPDEETHGVRRPADVFPRETFRGRSECEVVLTEYSGDECVARDREAASAFRDRQSRLYTRATKAADRGDLETVLECVEEANGEIAGLTDAPERFSGRYLFHRCLERCGDRLTDEAVHALLAVSPVAPFQSDAMRMLPVHILLSSCAPERLTAEMVEMLLAANPRACLEPGPRGWLPLHFWANRDPNDPTSFQVLEELLKPRQGARAARVADDAGDLPLHVFCKTCSIFKFAQAEEEYRGCLGTLENDGDDDDGPGDEKKACLRKQAEIAADDATVSTYRRVDPWADEEPRRLAKALAEAFVDAIQTPDAKGQTPSQLAPVEIREVLIDVIHEREKAETEFRRRASQAEAAKKLAEYVPLAAAVDGGDDARFLRALEDTPAVALQTTVDPYQGGGALHRVLRRGPAVPTSVFKALLHADPGAALVMDAHGWCPLHLFVKRAVDDCTVGTSGNLKRLLKLHPDAVSVRGGGSRKDWTPLHVLCHVLSRHNASRDPASGETRDDFDRRLALVVQTLVKAGPRARTRKDARGKTPSEFLPAAEYYDDFRGVCSPRDSSDDSPEKTTPTFNVNLRPEDYRAMFFSTSNDGATSDDAPAAATTSEPPRAPLESLDPGCVSLDLPGIELATTSRPPTPRVESTPVTEPAVELPAVVDDVSDRLKRHVRIAAEAERWADAEMRKQHAEERARLRQLELERRAAKRQKMRERKKAERDRRAQSGSAPDPGRSPASGARQRRSLLLAKVAAQQRPSSAVSALNSPELSRSPPGFFLNE